MNEFEAISQPDPRHGTLITVIGTKQMARVGVARVWVAVVLAICGSAAGQQATRQVAQAELPQAPSAVARPLQLSGGVMVEAEQPGAKSLTLDDAIATALKNNATVKIRSQNERFVHGEQLTALNTLLPTISASGYARAQEIDLRALGFKPGAVKIPNVNTS